MLELFDLFEILMESELSEFEAYLNISNSIIVARLKIIRLSILHGCAITNK